MYSDLIKEIQGNNNVDPVEAANLLLSKSGQVFPVKIVDIVSRMGFSVYLADELEDNCSGAIGIDARLKETWGNPKCVLLSKKIKPGKQRFVLAHEIAHYLFDFNEMDKSTYFNKYVGHPTDPCEIKANQFAAALLMPEEKFLEKYNEFSSTGIPVYEIISKLSDFFDTTIGSVELRLEETIKKESSQEKDSDRND